VQELAAEREHVLERGVHSRAGIPQRVETDPERSADGCVDVLGERHLRVRREELGEDSKRLVRVDPPATRLRDRRPPLERQSRCVSEQVPNGRAGRAGRFVEVDDTFLCGNEQSKRGDGLRDRGQPHDARDVALGRDDAGGIDNASGGKPDEPAVDLAKCLHAARY
jgi:hypothetical protein